MVHIPLQPALGRWGGGKPQHFRYTSYRTTQWGKGFDRNVWVNTVNTNASLAICTLWVKAFERPVNQRTWLPGQRLTYTALIRALTTKGASCWPKHTETTVGGEETGQLLIVKQIASLFIRHVEYTCSSTVLHMLCNGCQFNTHMIP